ncbi:hypothetical protein [Alloalcanivorax xenomutans]|uniref:hypothetical protein n=1 Tax=Alloalcanivorax xenomutans TaxID=1094342 RepID=UPI00300BF9B8
MELGELTFSFSNMQWILTVLVGIYAWLIGRQSARATEVLEMRSRLIALETAMKSVPTTDQLSNLVERLAGLEARLGGIAESMIPVAKNLDRVNDYLLKHR